MKRSALLAGAVAGSGVSAWPAQARRARNDLSPARERIYRKLVTGVSAADAAYADRVTDGFRAWYRSSLPHVRASVDSTLDALARTGLRRASANTAAQAIALARVPLTNDLRCAPAAI